MKDKIIGDSTRKYSKLIESFNETVTNDKDCRFQLYNIKGHLILKIIGNANKSGFHNLAQMALEIIAMNKAKSLIVDLSLCEQLTSSPLGMIALLLMTFKQRGGLVSIITNSDTIGRSVRILGLDKIASIHNDIDDVLS